MARRKRGKPHEEEISEAWLLPYSDLMTLLLALFIALYSMSQTDASKMQSLSQAFTAAFNMGGPSFFSGAGMNTSQSTTTSPTTTQEAANRAYLQENESLNEAKEKLEEYIKENNLQDQVSTELSEEGLMIRLKEKALFSSGSASLEGDAEKLVPVIANLLSSMPERVTISGHTDNVPIATAQYPSNWELSSARAVSVMRGLMQAQPTLNPARFSALGYGEYRPVASNDDEAGRAQNRRVEVFVSRSMRFGQEMPVDDGQGNTGGTTMKPVNNTPGVVPEPLQR